MKSSLHRRFGSIRSVTFACCVVLYLGFSEAAFGQPDALFDTASVESRLTRQLKLTPKERTALRPLLEWESDDLLLLYGYYADQDDPDFLSLWNALRARQAEFAERASGGLTRRQKKALLLARFEFEKRILGQWLNDHLLMLNELLELDRIQFKHVQKAFDDEHRERLEILRKEASRRIHLDLLWQKLVDDRECKLEQIFSASQLRSYREVTNAPRLIAKNGRSRPDNNQRRS